MPDTYICADLHFNHKNIIAYENRPWPDREAMNQGLIANWNAVVKPEDTVFVLGDVGFCSIAKAKELVGQLNGHKVLIMGNHDRDRSVKTWQEIGFEIVSPWPIVYNEYIVMMHEPPTYFNEATPYFYIYGHVHGCPDYQDHTEHSACVSVERLNYFPAKLEYVINGTAYAHRQIRKEL
ncbi:MAG: metallophosphoesterase [Clostridia bacterium]|nr:metallophosphoesterase [Clostridia bacterium]